MTVLLPMKAFFKKIFNFLSEAEFNISCNKKLLYSMSEIALFSGELSFDVADLCFRCSYIKIVFHSNLQSITLNKKDDTCPLVDANLSA